MISHFFTALLICRWPDSNRHGVTRLILSQVRLPIPPQRHDMLYQHVDYSITFQIELQAIFNISYPLKYHRNHRLQNNPSESPHGGSSALCRLLSKGSLLNEAFHCNYIP